MRAAITDQAYILTDGGYPDYMLIKNLDAANSVYIDDIIAAPSSFGLEITAGGGITWAPHHPCYLQCLPGATAVIAYIFGTNLS